MTNNPNPPFWAKGKKNRTTPQMSNCSITTSGDDVRKILRSAFRSCPMAQSLGTLSECLLFLYKTHPCKWWGYPLWHILQFLLSKLTFSAWCFALNLDLQPAETENLVTHFASPHQKGMTRKWEGTLCRPEMKVEVYHDSKQIRHKSHYRCPSEQITSQCRSRNKLIFRWSITSFPLQPWRILTTVGLDGSPVHGTVAQQTSNTRTACTWGS